MRLLSVFFLIFLFPATALAQQAEFKDSGYELFSACTSHYDTDYGYCAGYVTAVADVLLQQPLYGFGACNHAPVKSQQLVDLVTLFLEDNPELQSRPAKLVVAMALARAFPCQ